MFIRDYMKTLDESAKQRSPVSLTNRKKQFKETPYKWDVWALKDYRKQFKICKNIGYNWSLFLEIFRHNLVGKSPSL